MGILHEYMSCWTTLGPFGYPRGPQNGPKQHQNGLEWLKITRMAQNGTAWPQMTLNTSHGYIAWLYIMLDHPGAIQVPTGAPKWPKTAPKWHRIAQNHQNGTAWPQMTLNTSHGYITWLYNMLDHHGPFSGAHGGPKRAQNNTKMAENITKMALHGPKCPYMTPNGPKTLPMGIPHDIVSCWTTLGPFQRPKGAP